MWLSRFTHYLLIHRYRTIVLTLAITLIPVLGMIGILIAALVTLCKGPREGAVVTVAATLPFFLSFYFSNDQGSSIFVWAAVGVAVLSNVLTYVFAVMLYRQASWSAMIQLAALLGVLVIAVIHLVYPGIAEWWGNQLQTYYTQVQAFASNVKAQANPVNETQLAAIDVSKHIATGMIAAAILFNAFLQLVVARWWQVIVFKPGSLKQELHGIRLSQLAGGLFILSMFFSYLGNSVVLDIMPVLYLLFCVAGLSLIHYLFGLMRSQTAWFWLSILYLALIFSLPTSVIIVAMLALFDIGLNIRSRLKKV